MNNTETSTQLVKLTREKEPTKLGAKSLPATKLSYTRLDKDPTGAELSINILNNQLTEDHAALLGKLKVGDDFVLVKEKKGEYWNFKDLKDKSKWVPYSGSNTANKPAFNKTSKNAYDDTGVKVGAARNNAVAILTATEALKGLEIEKALDLVDSVVTKIIKRQSVQEDNLRNNKLAEEDKLKTESYTQDLLQDENLPF